MTHSIEFLKKAREIGATHTRNEYEFYKILNDCVCCHDFGGWSQCFNGCDIEEWLMEITEIDFSPLDDYYADKALDILATGVSE